MVTQTLERDELRLVEDVARNLALHWYGKDGESHYNATFQGLAAEFAVIKYFNYQLGATPLIEFNTDYNNGGDGGFDFRCPKDLKWDVKSTKENFLAGDHARRTKANIIIWAVRATRYSNDEFIIKGFIPISQLNDRSIISDLDVRDLGCLIGAMPKVFTGPRVRGKIMSQFSAVNEIAQRVIGRIQLKQIVDGDYERIRERDSRGIGQGADSSQQTGEPKL